MRRLSLRTKVFLLFAGAALLTVVPALLLIADAVEGAVYERATGDLSDAAEGLRSRWARDDASLLNAATARAFDPRTAAAWRRARTAQLQRHLREGLDPGNVVAALDTSGRMLLGPPLGDTERQQLRADADLANLGAAPAGTRVALTEGGRVPLRLAARMVERMVLRDSVTESEPLGTVVVGVPLSAKGLRDDVKRGAEVALLVNDSLVGTTLSDSLLDEVRTLDPRQVRGQRGEPRSIRLGGQPYLATGFDVPTRGMRTSVVLVRPVADELRVAQGIKQALFAIGAATVILALVLAAVVSRIVARPAQALADASARLARGDYDAPLPRGADDEIGQLARAFGEMRQAIAAREERLRSAQAEMIHREKLTAMGRLVAQLSHEINNPIYNIQNCLEALERRGDPRDPNREFLALAQEELRRMATLTRQLLDQSRPLSDVAAPTDLNALTRRVLTLAGPKLAANGVRTEVALDPQLPPVTVHPEAIQQVLANLMDNAGDAMSGGGTLRVVTRALPDAVEVIVEDTGTGIPEGDLPHIFEAFYTTKPGVAGIGLGLFVSEGIVRGHRGRLMVESRVGEGSRFTVRLPRETLDESLAEAVAADPAEAA
jgi:signal transduction histidine kinase